MGVHNRRIKGSYGAHDPFSPAKAILFPANYLSDYLKAPRKAFNMPEVTEFAAGNVFLYMRGAKGRVNNLGGVI